MSKKKMIGSAMVDPNLTNGSSVNESTDLVTHILIKLGNHQPSPKQRQLIKTLLFNLSLRATLIVDSQLSPREKECLLLASLGYTVKESAELLDIKQNTVEDYHKSTKKKLQCKTIAKAVMEGIRYGWIKKP
jgi:DNA-binding CsgD family transcriptional regulator